MSNIDEILEVNRRFVSNKQYAAYASTKIPAKKLAILSCMDARLTELLTAALGIQNGDAVVIKNAGAVITDPYDSAVRSLLVAIYVLGVRDILVIGHYDCGVEGMNSTEMARKMMDRGITVQAMEGIDLDRWLRGFTRIEEAVLETVCTLRRHALLPADIRIEGFVMDPITGALNEM